MSTLEQNEMCCEHLCICMDVILKLFYQEFNKKIRLLLNDLIILKIKSGQ